MLSPPACLRIAIWRGKTTVVPPPRFSSTGAKISAEQALLRERADARAGLLGADLGTDHPSVQARRRPLVGRLDARPLRGQPLEIALEARGCAENQRPRPAPAEVGEGVRDAPRREDERPGPPRDRLVLHTEGEFTLQDVEALLERGVHVQRRAFEVGCEHLLDHRELSLAVLSAQAYPDVPTTCVRLQDASAVRHAFPPSDRWMCRSGVVSAVQERGGPQRLGSGEDRPTASAPPARRR